MKSPSKYILAAAMGAAALSFSGVSASAAIACNGNVCWHTHARYEYPSSARIVIHDDNWRWGPREHFRWREHEGRGYWRGNRWTTW